MVYVWYNGSTGSPPQHVGTVSEDTTCEKVLKGLLKSGWNTKYVGKEDGKFVAFANVEKFKAYSLRNGLFRELFVSIN